MRDEDETRPGTHQINGVRWRWLYRALGADDQKAIFDVALWAGCDPMERWILTTQGSRFVAALSVG